LVIVYPAVFHPKSRGGITVTFPDLPGCVSEGIGEVQAICMAREALSLWIDTQTMCDKPVPAPSPVYAIRARHHEYVTLIDVDLDTHARVSKGKSVKRSVSLPEWMDRRAIQENISLSKELQLALTTRFNAK